MNRYTHVLWDWNGTLLDDVDLSWKINNQILKKNLLKPISYEKYKAEFQFPVRSYYQKLGFDFRKISFEDIAYQYTQLYDQEWQKCFLYEYGREILKQLKQRGIQNHLLSASEKTILKKNIDFFEIRNYFVSINGMDNRQGESKKKIFEAFVEKKEECLLIGDTVHDAEIADEFGFPCVLLAHGHNSKEKLVASGQKVMANLQEFVNWF